MTAWHVGACARLWREVLLLAWGDLVGENRHAREARAFLASAWAAEMAGALGLDPRGPARLAAQERVPAVPEGCVTAREAARIAGVPLGTLRSWMTRGELVPVGKRGPGRKHALFLVEEVRARKAA